MKAQHTSSKSVRQWHYVFSSILSANNLYMTCYKHQFLLFCMQRHTCYHILNLCS